jgi:uncharacterized protein involved in exopolysaccharide biosynthesis
MSAIRSNPQSAVSAVANLMAQVTTKEVQLGAMRSYLNESSPEFQRGQSELTALRSQLARAEKENKGGGGGGDYISKYRDFKYYETLYELMSKQYEIARIDESREGAVIQVIDRAVVPERKSKPNKARMAVIASVSFGFVLLIFVFLRVALRDAMRNPTFAGKIRRLGEGIAKRVN